MSVTLSSLPGKFKCSLLNSFLVLMELLPTPVCLNRIIHTYIYIYIYTRWTPIKRIKNKLDGNCIRILRSISNNFWKWHPTKQQLFSNLLPISKTIQIIRTRHTEHCLRSNDELVRDILLWIPSYEHASVG